MDVGADIERDLLDMIREEDEARGPGPEAVRDAVLRALIELAAMMNRGKPAAEIGTEERDG